MTESLESRQQALREWAAANRDTPLGRVTGRILAEDDDDGGGSYGPEYYSGLFFALGVIMDEVL
jgi:hypothetical protein